MLYTIGENPLVVDRDYEPRPVDTCYDCGTAIYEDDYVYEVNGHTLCQGCGLEYFDAMYGRVAG